MQQDNTDKILKRIAYQQLPDLSQMDKHWKDMQQKLTVRPISKPVMASTGWWLIAAALLCLIGLFGLKNGWFSSGNTGTGNNKQLQQEMVVTPVEQKKPDTISIFRPMPPVIGFQPTIAPPNKYSNYIFTTGDAKDSSEKIIPVPATNSIASTDLNAGQTEEMNALLMQQFWAQLEKNAQRFVIDNRIDNLITCTEGTAISIPAAAFSNTNDKITIEVKEFYSYDDIIANKLSTISNGVQLISDGMLSVKAIQNGKEVDLNGIKPIDIRIPRRDFDQNMQLFTGVWTSGDQNADPMADYAAPNSRELNWMPVGQFQKMPDKKHYVKSFDPYGQPYKIRETPATGMIGKFLIARNCKMTDKEALEGLKMHFGMFYNKIKLRRSLSNHPHKFLSNKTLPVVGDSVMIDYQMAKKLNLISKSDIARMEEQLKKDSIEYEQALRGTAVYQFSVSRLGFMNCDRFQNNVSEKIEFTLNLGDDKKADDFFTVLAFEKYRSVLQGSGSGSMVRFRKIPVDQKVFLISVGVRDGKVMSCVQPYTVSNKVTKIPEYTETNPEEFKQKLAALKL